MKTVGAVIQAFRLLRALAAHPAPQGASVVARRAEVNTSTAFNILRTLVIEGAVEFDPASKTYWIGRGLLDLTSHLLERDRIADLMGELNRVASDTGCLVGLWQVGPDRMILLERAVADRPMRLDLQVKQRMPLMLGAVGRALAAHEGLKPSELRERFKTLRWEGAISMADYVRQVQDAARRGYGLDREALYPGVVSVGTLIIGRDGQAIYGLTASGFTATMDDASAHAVGERLVGIVSRWH